MNNTATKRTRHGLATVELLIAMPIIAAVFAALMFLAHASYKKNDDYARKHWTLMSRHTTQPPQFDDSGVKTTLNRLDMQDNQNAVKNFFPPTQTWAATVSQNLDYQPFEFAAVGGKTNDSGGKIYKGTGSTEYRTAKMLSLVSDKVDELEISKSAIKIGKEVGVALETINEFKNLLSAIKSVKSLADVSLDDVMKQAKEAGKQAAEQLVEFVKEEAEELAKSALTRDWDKIRSLQKQIKFTPKALEQLSLAESNIAKLDKEDQEFSAAVEQ